MRFITGGASPGKRSGRDDFAIVRRVFIKVYDCQKVRIGARLISSPDEKKSRPLAVPNFFSILFLESILCGSGGPVPGGHRTDQERDQNKDREYYAPVNIGSYLNHNPESP
jgi:hypothetical protein